MEGCLFIPAHADAVADIRPLAEVNRAKVQEILGVVLELCREPIGFEELLQKLFTRYQLTMDFSQYVLVGSTVRSYLAYLLDKGAVAASFDDSRLLWRAV
ncbi:MAG: MBL fold metallo-hydrolase, partial [Dysosmobacter sp.]